MTIRNYRDLHAWQRAMELATEIYRTTGLLPPEERFGLTAQMRRAVVSIASNIAEGKGRRTDGEFLNQLSIAHGSLCELETQILLLERLNLLAESATSDLMTRCAEVGRLVNGLVRSIDG